ncbi:MAG: hypothetical protein V2B13_03775 [Pseudomonadota bacterium]
MKGKSTWIVLGILLLAIFVLTFLKTPGAIKYMLENVSRETKNYSAFVHLLFLVVIGLGLFGEKIRNGLFSLFIAFLSLSATIIAVKYVIAPNVIIFGMFFVLIIHAYLTKKLNFDLKNIGSINLLFGILGLTFGFWYLHWVENPVWLNAFIYSPLGVVNCPTMVTICGFLCLSQKPRSTLLEATVGLVTLFFGFFGLFRLRAYVDVALILCGLFLIVRLSSYLVLIRK